MNRLRAHSDGPDSVRSSALRTAGHGCDGKVSNKPSIGGGARPIRLSEYGAVVIAMTTMSFVAGIDLSNRSLPAVEPGIADQSGSARAGDPSQFQGGFAVRRLRRRRIPEEEVFRQISRPSGDVSTIAIGASTVMAADCFRTSAGTRFRLAILALRVYSSGHCHQTIARGGGITAC